MSVLKRNPFSKNHLAKPHFPRKIPGKPPLHERCDSASQMLKALSHPQRLMILCHLSGGEKTVGELERLSGASQSSVSQFLGRMKSEGLVAARREGSFVHYGIRDARVRELIQAMNTIFN